MQKQRPILISIYQTEYINNVCYSSVASHISTSMAKTFSNYQYFDIRYVKIEDWKYVLYNLFDIK